LIIVTSLGSRYPRAGGAAFVTQKAYGMPLLSFVLGLAVVCSGLASVATQSQVFARNLSVLLGPGAWPVAAIAAGFLRTGSPSTCWSCLRGRGGGDAAVLLVMHGRC
jgi:amino acid transporter